MGWLLSPRRRKNGIAAPGGLGEEIRGAGEAVSSRKGWGYLFLNLSTPSRASAELNRD